MAIHDSSNINTFQMKLTNRSTPFMNHTGSLDLTTSIGNFTLPYAKIREVHVVMKPQSGQPRLVV